MSDVAMTNTDAAAAIGAKPRFDFPTWLPPMLVKELRQGLRTRGFVFSLIGLHVVLVIAFAWALVAQIFDRSSALGIVNGFYWTITVLLLCFITPLRGLSGLRSEIDARNIDLLMLTDLTAWRIVAGKWSSLVTQTALLMITLLPYGVVRYFFGGVDLLSDLYVLAWMFGVSCTATALTLWFSGMHKLLRILVVVIAVLVLNSMFGLSFFSMVRYGFGSRGIFSGGSGAPLPIQLCLMFDLGILLVFCLLQAVRRIAPPSENHSIITRLLGLAALVPIPVLAFFNGSSRRVSDALEMQSVIALVAFMLVCVLELTTVELPMSVHVRTLLGRGGFVRSALARLFLPGWESAALFTLVGLVFFVILNLTHAFPDPLSSLRFLRVLGLAWVAVVLPSAVMSWFIKQGKILPVVVYGLIQAAIGLLCIFAAFVINELSRSDSFSEIMGAFFRVMPVTSFWFELGYMTKRHDDLNEIVLTVQIVMVLCMLCFVFWRSGAFRKAFRDGVASMKKISTDGQQRAE